MPAFSGINAALIVFGLNHVNHGHELYLLTDRLCFQFLVNGLLGGNFHFLIWYLRENDISTTHHKARPKMYKC
jgi:hypothetical protein